MKIDRKALYSGLLLVAAIPALLLYQSSNKSRGTNCGRSKYNVYHELSLLCEQLHLGRLRLLHVLCYYTLGESQYANYKYSEAWVDYFAAKYGECADVHLGRAWLCNYRRDRSGVEREFAAALAAARDKNERAYIQKMINMAERYLHMVRWLGTLKE